MTENMFLGMPLPTWKQIVTREKRRNSETYYEKDDVLLLAESCMSIYLILESIKNVKKRSRVKIIIPDYFCNQTVYSFQEIWMEVSYYPIDEFMNPDWNYVKKWTKENEFDAFLFVHYFGKYHGDINRAKEICKNHDAVLIEDCAHTLYPTGKIGINGDFVIYSPHKQLPIRDGAVLFCNMGENKPVIRNLYEWIKEKYNELPQNPDSRSWYIKKSLQKILHIHHGLTYYSGVHFGKEIGSIHKPKKISQASYNILCDFAYIDYKKAAYIRRGNLEMMNYIISQKYPDLIPCIGQETDVPYFAAYSLENVKDKERVVKEMIKSGFTVLYWPDLPIQIKSMEGHECAKVLSSNIIVLPVHQDLRPQKLAKKFLRGGGKTGLSPNRSKKCESG